MESRLSTTTQQSKKIAVDQSQAQQIDTKNASKRKVEAIFKNSSGDEDDDEIELDPKTSAAIQSLAKDIGQKGSVAEAEARSKYKNSPNYWFLYDTESLAYKHLKNLVKRQSNIKNVADPSPSTISYILLPEFNKPKIVEQIPQKSDVNTTQNTKKRKSRWGDKNESVAVANLIQISNPSPSRGIIHHISMPVIKSDQSMQKSQTEADQPCSSTSLASEDIFDEEMFKAQILARQLAAKALAKAIKKCQSNEYDSDEDTEGGTFEHKIRMVEMQKTLDKANQLTEVAQEKHHLSDFLPPEEHEKFFEMLHKARNGDLPESSQKPEDYLENKLNSDNLGFKLLQKMGWKEGKGIGANEQLQALVNKGKVAKDLTGLGHGSEEKSEDLYDFYRKRMMEAYKFRPNPMNNPRRQYY